MSVKVHFTSIDYFFFTIVFIVSITIGLYIAFKKKTQRSVDEYFFGGKKLGTIPVICSILATGISGSIIGQSIEIYAYGLHNFMYVVTSPIWSIVLPVIFLPVFYDLQIKSSFTYLELRFDKSVKHFASALYVITGFFYIPLTIYIPAISFQEVSGVNLYMICIVSGMLCIWYTSIGGLKAVIWTDVFQFSLIMLSTLIIFSVGLVSIGGFTNAWNALERGGRLNVFRTDLNLQTRGSFWAHLFTTSILSFYNFNLTQSAIQRFLLLGTFEKAKSVLGLELLFTSIFLLMQFTIGAVIYTTYEECDPLSAGIVGKIDQIFAYFVQEKASLFTGFNGIFIAGTFSAGLSTTSTLINTMSGTIYMDFLNSKLRGISENNKSRIMKLIVILVGIIGIALIILIERMGTVYAITIQCLTITAVGIFGLCCNGIIFKNINSKGAKCGVIASMIVLGILIIGSLRKSPYPVLPLRIDGCDFMNSTTVISILRNPPVPMKEQENIPWIFQIDFQFFAIIAIIINIVVESIVSSLTGGNTVNDQRLLAKFLRKNIPQAPQENLPLSSF